MTRREHAPLAPDGDRPSTLPLGGGRDEGSSFSFLHREILPCAAITISKDEEELKETNPVEIYDEFDEDLESETEEEDEESFNGERMLKDLKQLLREVTRKDLEEHIVGLPGVESVRVDLEEDDEELVDAAYTTIDLTLHEDFHEVLEIFKRDLQFTNHAVITHLEGIATFMEDMRYGKRSIEEISNELSFDRCLEIIKGSKEAEEDTNQHQENEGWIPDEGFRKPDDYNDPRSYRIDGDDKYDPHFSFSINVEDIPKNFEEVRELAKRVAQDVYLFGQGLAKEGEADEKGYVLEEGG